MGSSQWSDVHRGKAAQATSELAVKHASTQATPEYSLGKVSALMLCPLMGQIAVAPRPICQGPTLVICWRAVHQFLRNSQREDLTNDDCVIAGSGCGCRLQLLR